MVPDLNAEMLSIKRFPVLPAESSLSDNEAFQSHAGPCRTPCITELTTKGPTSRTASAPS